ncbi:unnamed protein product [Adineta ricciae]|uniref:Uncharacterized protein n=1 Tax=Adineta ricciae TaxID=249248 RepID=A0A815UKU9_ADIRI|nr:unnamed protein product [Adineta ricciae]CAF1524062.1 unnamed protein product [Adineta ricciae]
MQISITLLALVFFSFILADAYRIHHSRNYDRDTLVQQLRRLIEQESEDDLMVKRKTQAGLDHPEILKECQNECKYLRVDASVTDEELRKPYKKCRDECVDEKLAEQD